MNQTDNLLTRDMIERPELWRLAMRVDGATLHAAVLSTVMLHDSPTLADSLIYRAIALDPAAPTPLKALEEAIYANDLLLTDFAQVEWIVGADHALLIPAEASGEQADALFHEAFDPYPADALTEPATYRTLTVNASIVWAEDAATAAFLRRTFPEIRFEPSLGVLIDYFATSTGRGNSRRMYVNFRPESIDVIVLDRTRLLHGVTIGCATPADAAYYVIACRRLHNLSDADEAVVACGESPLREPALQILNRFVGQVMPAIFPSDMLKAGRDAIHAPFELTAALLAAPSKPLNPPISQSTAIKCE